MDKENQEIQTYNPTRKNNRTAAFLLNITEEDFSFPNYSLFLQKVRR